jgi:hypothetical protein
MTTKKKSVNKGTIINVPDKNMNLPDIELENEYLKIELANAKSQIQVLTTERDSFIHQLAKVAALGSQEKESLVNHLLKKYPDCLSDLVYGVAFAESAKA